MKWNVILSTAFALAIAASGFNVVVDSFDGAGKNPAQSALISLNDLGGNKTLTKGVPTNVNGYDADDMLVKGKFTKAVTGK